MDLTAKIIRDRYLGTNWNIYVTQVSDGDAWGQPDCEKTYDIIQKHIINHIRYFAYIETSRYAQLSQLYTMYTELDKEHSNFSMQRVFQESQIWSVFQKLFEKNKTRV